MENLTTKTYSLSCPECPINSILGVPAKRQHAYICDDLHICIFRYIGCINWRDKFSNPLQHVSWHSWKGSCLGSEPGSPMKIRAYTSAPCQCPAHVCPRERYVRWLDRDKDTVYQRRRWPDDILFCKTSVRSMRLCWVLPDDPVVEGGRYSECSDFRWRGGAAHVNADLVLLAQRKNHVRSAPIAIGWFISRFIHYRCSSGLIARQAVAHETNNSSIHLLHHFISMIFLTSNSSAQIYHISWKSTSRIPFTRESKSNSLICRPLLRAWKHDL